MRALFYVEDPAWPGSSRAILAAARGLRDRGHEVSIACPEGSVLERLAGLAGFEPTGIARGTGTVGAGLAVRRLLRDRFIDAVFVHGEREHFVAASAIRFADRGAIIRRVPSFGESDPARGARLALKLATAGLLYSTDQELAEAQSAGGWGMAAAVAPLGVDIAEYESLAPAARASIGAPSGLLIACAYEPSGRFNLATLLRTVAILAQHHPDLHVAVVGPGSLDEDLRMHAAALAVSARVSFLGERDDMLAVLRAADVGWVAGTGDGAAFACLDFMALGTPVLAERSRLTEHYIADGITGVLLPPVDTPGTASNVAAFLGMPDRQRAMGNAGRTRVQREFALPAMLDGFENALSIAGGRGAPAAAAATATPTAAQNA